MQSANTVGKSPRKTLQPVASVGAHILLRLFLTLRLRPQVHNSRETE